VLLVEDEQDVAELIRYNLTKESYDVVLSGNGNEALRPAREHRPDVLLLDIMVLQLNGWEVCRRIKKDPELATIPVIGPGRIRRTSHRGCPCGATARKVHDREARGARNRDRSGRRVPLPRQTVTHL